MTVAEIVAIVGMSPTGRVTRTAISVWRLSANRKKKMNSASHNNQTRMEGEMLSMIERFFIAHGTWKDDCWCDLSCDSTCGACLTKQSAEQYRELLEYVEWCEKTMRAACIDRRVIEKKRPKFLGPLEKMRDVEKETCVICGNGIKIKAGPLCEKCFVSKYR